MARKKTATRKPAVAPFDAPDYERARALYITSFQLPAESAPALSRCPMPCAEWAESCHCGAFECPVGHGSPHVAPCPSAVRIALARDAAQERAGLAALAFHPVLAALYAAHATISRHGIVTAVGLRARELSQEDRKRIWRLLDRAAGRVVTGDADYDLVEAEALLEFAIKMCLEDVP